MMQHISANAPAGIDAPESALLASLRGRRLAAARAAWLVTAAFAILLLLASIPIAVGQLGTTTPLEQWRDAVTGVPLSQPDALEFPLDLLTLIVGMMSTAAYLALAAVLFRRRGTELLALLFSLCLMLFGTLITGPFQTLTADEPNWFRAGYIGTVIIFQAFWFFFFLFPDGVFVPRWTRWLLWALALWTAGTILFADIVLPTGRLTAAHIALLFLWHLSFPAGGVAAQIYRYRRVSNALERQQTKWVVFGFGAMMFVFLVLPLLFTLPVLTDPATHSDLTLFGMRLFTLIYPACLSILPLTMGIAILRFRLWDIDLILKRALVYGTLTTLIVAVYVLVVGGLGALLRMNVGAAGFVLATVLSLLLIQPARARLQRGVDRVMYGSEQAWSPVKPDPAERRRDRPPAEPGDALSPLDIVFRVLAALGAVEIVALAYQLVTYPTAPGIIGQPYFERVLLGLLVAPLVLAIGAFLLWRVPGNVVPRFILLFGLFGVAGQFDIGLNASSTPALAAVLFIAVGAGLVAPSMGYLMMHFPTGRLYPPQFAPWLKLIAGVKFAGVMLEVLATPGDIKVFRIGANPMYVPALGSYLPLIGASAGITGVLLPLILIGGMLSLLLRFRASSPAERAQIRWVIGGFAGLLAAMLTGVVFVFSGGAGSAAAVGVLLLAGAALLWFVVSVAVAIARHRLYGIEQVVNRTLVYGTLTVCVAGFYVVVVGSISTLLQTGNNLVISLLATGLIAVIFQPLRERLQRGVNHLLYGERDEPYIVLSRLGERLEATLAPEAMLRAIVESVATALKLPYVAIELADGNVGQMTDELYNTPSHSPTLAAVYGQSVAKTVSIPLNFQAETMGALLLAPRAGEERFDDADLRLLNDLARQVGVAAHAVRLSADLQRSRERIVTAREEERRRIRRDLHDGLGPALAALTLKLDAARNLADRDTVATKTLLAELRGQTQAAITDIRRLVYDLRPPALDELGLVPALREYAARLTSDGLQITLEADALPPLSAAAEVATYRIVTEALTNVVHHAYARHAQVRLSCAGMLHLEVMDDGAGLPPNVRAGVGLTSMRERAEELGGTFVIESPADGGTQVCAQLPFEFRRLETKD